MVGVAALAVSAYGAYSANKNGKEANKNAEKSSEAQLAAAHEQLDFSKEQYGDWKSMFYPVLGDMKTMAYQDTRPDYEAITADTNAAFDTSRQIGQRQMQRFGVNPADGAYADSQNQYGIGRATALVGARQNARQQNKDSRFQRLSNFFQAGNGMYGTSSNMMNAAYAGVMNSNQNAGAMWGNRGAYYQDQYQSGLQDVAGGLGYMYGNRNSGDYYGISREGALAPSTYTPGDFGVNTAISPLRVQGE